MVQAGVIFALIPVRVKQSAVTTVDIPEDWDPNTKKSHRLLFCLPAGGRVPSIPRSGCIKKLLNPKIEELFMTRTGIEPMLQP